MNECEMTGVPADAGALWRSGADIESLFKFMREGGFNQAQSTEALERVALIELGRESGDSTITETELDDPFDPETILHSTIAT